MELFLCSFCDGNGATEVQVVFLLPQLTHCQQENDVLPLLTRGRKNKIFPVSVQQCDVILQF